MSNKSESDEQSIADLYTLHGRKIQIEKQLVELNSELKSVNKKLNLGQGQTSPSEKLKIFEETLELYKFVESRKEVTSEKSAIEEYIKNNRPSEMSKITGLKKEVEKQKKRLIRFRLEFFKD